MKFIMLVVDGMADYPVMEMQGRTPLQVAKHPNMDALVRGGITGAVRTIPDGMDANTDVAFLSLLGYDPLEYHAGRGALEAVNRGIELTGDEVAFRFNLIREEEGLLKDYAAGHISTEDAGLLVKALSESLGSEDVRFYAGVSYRHILVLKGYSEKVHCYAAHDVVGKPIRDLWVTAEKAEAQDTADLLNTLMVESKKILACHQLSRERKTSANMIWPWGPGKKPAFPTLLQRYGLEGAVISAVDVVNGLGIFTGMDVITVPGATGFIDTNYEGKADYALEALRTHDFVLLHVEAPDEAGHLGDHELKVKTIEDVDRRLLGRLLAGLQGKYTIVVLPDHPTPTSVRTHTRDPVPFVMYSSERPTTNRLRGFDETVARDSDLRVERGCELIDFFLDYGRG
jgi:2,3-bisphosphoglycerate-independent phosphoglycerate mutase